MILTPFLPPSVHLWSLSHSSLHPYNPGVLWPTGSQLLPQEMPPSSLLFLTHFTTTLVCARWGLFLCCHKLAQRGMCLRDKGCQSVAVHIHVDFHLWLFRPGKLFCSLPFKSAPESKPQNALVPF